MNQSTESALSDLTGMGYAGSAVTRSNGAKHMLKTIWRRFRRRNPKPQPEQTHPRIRDVIDPPGTGYIITPAGFPDQKDRPDKPD